ncbi:hypothetical protein JTB14_007415 [Gonioctena quinquepunctata]|nr:hypothetical protein JTB14_007415 [Gonioctena quinquepunctata]
MFSYLLFVLFCFVTTSYSEVPEKNKYTTKYDNINLEEIIKNDRLLKNYVDCLLEKRRCTPDGLELKKNMPDAIETDCSKCSEKQKEGRSTILREAIRRGIWMPRERKSTSSLLSNLRSGQR